MSENPELLLGLMALLNSVLAVLGLGLATTGFCFLGLWNLRVVQPPPRFGAALLFVSSLGAARALFDIGPAALIPLRWFPFVAAPLLLFVAVFTLLGQERR
jgi:hypothetical protein